MYYIYQNGDDFGFKCDEIHEITEFDVPISAEIYHQFFSVQCGDVDRPGKCLRIKDINGTTFEEIFEEYIPEPVEPEPSELDLLKARVEELERIVASFTGSEEDFVIGDALRITDL